MQKKPYKAAWSSVCLPKSKGGLGVINISVHNDALLLKFLSKFYNRADIPWINLVWENYYQNGKLPGQQKKGSFWWRDIIKLTNLFKGVAIPKVQEGSTILFWQDLWNVQILQHQFPELFSFALNPNATVKAVLNAPPAGSEFSSPPLLGSPSATHYAPRIDLRASATFRTRSLDLFLGVLLLFCQGL
jgi:hypothetical protein